MRRERYLSDVLDLESSHLDIKLSLLEFLDQNEASRGPSATAKPHSASNLRNSADTNISNINNCLAWLHFVRNKLNIRHG